MGLYFTVRKDEGDKCPYCNHPIREWQSKDSIGDRHNEWGGCCDKHLVSLPILEKDEVVNFYEICTNPACEKWIEYENRHGQFVLKGEVTNEDTNH